MTKKPVEKAEKISTDAVLIDFWNHAGYGGSSGRLIGTSVNYEKQYVGVFQLPDGKEITLLAPYNLELIGKETAGMLIYQGSEMIDFIY